MVTIEKEKIMSEMVDSLRERMKFFRETTTRDLANVYIGELHGFEIYFNIVGARGTVSDETIKTSGDFRKELEDARQILSKKFEAGELK